MREMRTYARKVASGAADTAACEGMMAQADEREYYTVAQAAALLEVSPSTVWRWIKADRLPAYRAGPKNIRIKKEDLQNVIQPAKNGAIKEALDQEEDYPMEMPIET